ncbi:glycosyltransferase [Kaistella polysaccharea]|uniref:glycosyltransferase n=1 Tax=Kaistella polysaccharea TaxID=2878534 RepID=UPI001CF59CE1|nr:glycosyltransferase [Kaistella polysaccharea]
MKAIPKISVLIAHYNSGKYFEQAFESLQRQTELNWEAIIIDDASTDGSLALVKTLIKNDRRFTIIENATNVGCASTLKTAIETSTAPLFARLDPDDTLMPNALEKSIRAHEKFSEVGLVYSNHLVCDENLKIQKVHQCKQITDLTTEDSFLYHGEIAQFASFKREFFDRTAGVHTFNKRAEDVDMYLKMCEVAAVFHLDETLYNYRIRPNSLRQFENAERTKFWYWVAAIKMAERRNLNIEDFFVKHCARRTELQVYLEREARLMKMIEGNIFLKTAFNLGQKLRLFEADKILEMK